MDITIQLNGLDRFLTAIYGEQTHLAGLLDEMGFEPAQSQWLREQRREQVAAQFVEALHRKLTSGDKDLWFHLMCRRFGLDGEPPTALEETARVLHVEPGYATKADMDALKKCRYKTTLRDLEKELHRIALAELSQAGAAPAKDEVVLKLHRLADLRAAEDLARMDYEAKRAEVLLKVQAELDALEEEYQPILDAAEENASTLEGEIKNDVLLGGKSVMTNMYQAIYVKGRVTWDNEGITRYAQAHPEVLKYRKEGQPNVTLRMAGKSKGE